MYTMVLMMAMSGSGDAASFGHKSGCAGSACYGTAAVTNCCAPAPVSTGCTGSKHGLFGGLFNRGGSSCHGSKHHHGSASCYGSYPTTYGAGCTGTVVGGSAGCTGTVVGYPMTGTTVMPGTTTVMPGTAMPAAPATPAMPPVKK